MRPQRLDGMNGLARTWAAPWLSAAIALGAVLSGCEPEQVEHKAEPRFVTRGIISATASRYVESGAPRPYEQFEMAAVFPRFKAEDERIVDSLLGERVPSADLALDTCSQPIPVLNTRPRRRENGETAIELLDVGDINVEFGEHKAAVPTRTFPDLLKVIDGVIYSANESSSVTFEPGEVYTIEASGTDDIGAFGAGLEAPDELGEVKLDGIPIYEQMPVIRRGEDLEITWEGEGYGDEVIATINWTNVGISWSMSCRMKDDGRFSVPAEVTGLLLDPLVNNDHEMSLSRVRQVSFRSDGLRAGEFSFVVATSFLVRFESSR